MHWRHEQLSLRMALAAATHHSAQSRAKEGVEGETNDAPRRPKPPLPGTRPEPLEEVAEPQGLSAAPRWPDAGVPLLSVPLLAGRDGIDNTTVRWLLKLELRTRQREEEKEEKKKQEKAAESRRRAQALLDHAASLPKRKRKKRRKRRTPRTSSLPGRARRRQRQWSACNAVFTGCDAPRVMFPSGVARPKLLRILAGMDQKDSCSGHLVLCFLLCLQARDARHHGWHGPQDSVEVHRCSSRTRFFTCPLVCYECRHGPDSAENCLAIPQVQLIITVIFIPVGGAEAFPVAQTIQQTIEIPLLPFRRLGCAGSASSSGAGVEKTAVSHIALVSGCRRGEHV